MPDTRLYLETCKKCNRLLCVADWNSSVELCFTTGSKSANPSILHLNRCQQKEFSLEIINRTYLK